MKFNRPGPSRLEIRLTAEDLGEMGVRCEELDGRSEKFRGWLLSLLETAYRASGYLPEGRLSIEVVPEGDGGCAVRLENLEEPPRRWKVRRREQSPVIYAFDDVDTLITGSVKLFGRCSHRIRKSALYRVEDGWRLLLYPLDTLENRSLALMDEYAPRCGQGPVAAAWLGEHGRLLVEDNAVDILSAYFG